MVKKRIIILSADLGGGHNAAATAVAEAMMRYFPDEYEVQVINTLSLLGDSANKIGKKFLETSAQYSKKALKAFYVLTDKSEAVSVFDKRAYPLIKSSLEPLLDLKPDILVATFPFLNYSVKKFYNENGIKVPLVTLVTDTGQVHTAWISEKTDYYIVSSKETAFYVAEKGVEKMRIKAYGMPLRQQFYGAYDAEKTKKNLRVRPGNKVVLYLGGSLGNGKFRENLRVIDEGLDGITLVAVCGKNKRALAKLKKEKFYNQVLPLGYTENMAEILNAADVVVTKAGGISVMEAVKAKKPILVSEVISIQEVPNARFVEAMGFGYVEKKPRDIAERLKFMLEYDLERINRNLEAYSLNDFSDRQVAEFVNGLVGYRSIFKEKVKEEALLP